MLDLIRSQILAVALTLGTFFLTNVITGDKTLGLILAFGLPSAIGVFPKSPHWVTSAACTAGSAVAFAALRVTGLSLERGYPLIVIGAGLLVFVFISTMKYVREYTMNVPTWIAFLFALVEYALVLLPILLVL